MHSHLPQDHPLLPAQPSHPFDLTPALNAFLHELGILPLSKAASLIPSPSEPLGKLLGYRFHHDLSALELDFLLSILDLRLFDLRHNISHPQDTVAYLCKLLTRLSLIPAFTEPIGRHFGPILPELVSRWLIELGFQPNGTYGSEIHNLWPDDSLLGQDQKLSSSDSHGENRENTKALLRAVFSSFSIWLDMHPSLFQFLILILRHPAFTTDPFNILPASILSYNIDLVHDVLPSTHPLFNDPLITSFLLSLHRLLSVAPHLPFPGIIKNGWLLPHPLVCLMQHHPRQGMRYLAWRCWRYWQGEAGFAQFGIDVRKRYVWKPETNDCESSLIVSNLHSPWSTAQSSSSTPEAPDSIIPASKNLVDSLPDEFIQYDEQLTSKWDLRVSSDPQLSTVSYQTVARAIDAWVLPMHEDWWRGECHKTPLGREPTSVVPRPLFLSPNLLSPLVNEVEGLIILRFCSLPPSIVRGNQSSIQNAKQNKNPNQTLKLLPEPPIFIPTPSSRTAIRSLARSIEQRLPILLSGPSSSGKTTIIQEVVNLFWSPASSSNLPRPSGHAHVVTLNLASRTLDAKSLIGSHVSSTEDAGKFVFVEGPLTRAMREGKWLICRDIDRASDDILAIINQVADLIRHRAQYEVGGGIGGHGCEHGVGIDLGAQLGWVAASERFALIATRTTTDDHTKSFIGERYWDKVEVPKLRHEDVIEILAGIHSSLSPAVRDCLVDAWMKVSNLRSTGESRRQATSLRELMRWARRVEALVPNNQVLQSVGFNPIVQESIFLEAVDVFLASSDRLMSESETLKDADLSIAISLGSHLGLNEERTKYCLYQRTPDFILPLTKSAKEKKRALLQIGRIKLPIALATGPAVPYSRPFALTKSSLVLLERLANCIKLSEPILLVGETGTGKTSIVSFLAKSLSKSLVSLNLSNQSEASDLLGGFKPLDFSDDAKLTGSALIDEFTQVFGDQFSLSRNQEFIMGMRKSLLKKKWSRLVTMWKEAIRALAERARKLQAASAPALEFAESPSKRRKISESESALPSTHLKAEWQAFLDKVEQFEDRFVRSSSSQVRFKYVEGPLVKAMQRGDWVLLDEINLGTGETLESLGTLLQHPNSSLVLSERGDLEPVRRDPEFRLIGCMNPATDVGKRDLPPNLRCKFTEFYVQPPDNDREALLNIVSQYLSGLCVSDKRVVTDVADCYSTIRTMAQSGQVADGTNSPPHYSMRTLSRALTFAVDISASFTLRRALVEGFLMSFVTTLDAQSSQKVSSVIDQNLVKTIKNSRAVMNQTSKKPVSSDSQDFIQVGPFWLRKGTRPEDRSQKHSYVLTESVKSKMIDLARAVTTGRYPVLIQGPTSSGKTSIVEYLAEKTGHTFLRINNHEHTDIQEYIGSYVTDPDTGQLCFKEGALVRALRNGEWVVLDELNLAPSDVLEALNRLLDDNRELLIPETQEVVRPHPHFMLFATQNPPGLYGGRKVLSRAFRNRFLELHFDDVPTDELEIILCERCQIAPSYSKKIVQVFTELQRRRQTDRIFEQKHSFVTLRDLFRWGGRGAVGYQQLAEDGYMLLAERSRGAEEKVVVKDVLEEVMKVVIDPSRLYENVKLPKSLVPTAASKRLFKLLSRALEFHEPVLLVGEAGSGKTSVCEAFSECRNSVLRCINLHRNSEVGDLLGSQRPVRNRVDEFRAVLEQAASLLVNLGVDPVRFANFEVHQMIEWIEGFSKERKNHNQHETLDQLETILKSLRHSLALFTWKDGPLVQAMREGEPVLLDEISLADDSVLERLNSLLEPNRSIVLAECGGATIEEMQIKAHPSFEIMATMNPGGDFGKRELSPALRNRFTEIWVPLVSEPADRTAIFAARLSSSESGGIPSSECLIWAERIVAFSSFFSQSPASSMLSCRELSLRDGLAWCDFIRSCSTLSAPNAFVNGAQMTVLDRLGTAGFGQDLSPAAIKRLRDACFVELHKLAGIQTPIHQDQIRVLETDSNLQIGYFSLSKAAPTLISRSLHQRYSFDAPTVAQNALRIIRALQVPKSILLEGSPGVGKTSMVEALARLTGRRLRRINLSDQTDLLDLFGSDVPVEGGRAGEFAWRDAAFLDALQRGDWVLLDEMNLAPQTVLEGLNACLDHRGSVYVPELDRTFARHPDFRVFAAQNPHHQGGSRKGLPRSLVDRFTVVFMKELEKVDLFQICTEIAPGFDSQQISRMVDFNDKITREVEKNGIFGSCGSPWEFNLRDIGRWLHVTTRPSELDRHPNSPLEYIDMIYTGRFRTTSDHKVVENICSEFFDITTASRDRQDVVDLPTDLIIGHSRLQRSRAIGRIPSVPSPSNLPTSLRRPAESLMRCLELKWLPILTGPEQSGKTSVVKYLASRTGARMRVISMHSGSDTSDLFGGFEQSNAHRNALHIIDSISHAIQLSLENQLILSTSTLANLKATLRHLHALSASFPSTSIETVAKELTHVLDGLTIQSGVDISSMARAIGEMQGKQLNSRFEWIDGPLVAAMKQGDWLVIENANLCSGSVLDRLNPLFEGNSQLQLTERGIHQGEIVTITPHPDFRIIMVFNPRHGELSRAMRNRGIEISFVSNADLDNRVPDGPVAQQTREAHPQLMFNSPWSPASLRDLKAEAPIRWATELLVHSPTRYPLLGRLLGHTSSSVNQKLTWAMSRLSQPDLRIALESFAMANRMSHVIVGKTMDLALVGRSFQPALDPSLAEIHRLILTMVLAACCPVVSTQVMKDNLIADTALSLSSKPSKQINAWMSLLDPASISNFIESVNRTIIELATRVLAESVANDISVVEFSTFRRSLHALQTAVTTLTGLLKAAPDYASFGFSFQIIHQTLLGITPKWETFIQPLSDLLLPLKLAFDITRWDSMVRLWNLFCPFTPRQSTLQDVLRELEVIGALHLRKTKPELRQLFFEVLSSMRVSYDPKPDSVANFKQIAQQLREQILSSDHGNEPESVRPMLSDLGRAVEQIIGIIGVLSYKSESESRCDPSFRQLLADSRGISSELGVLLHTQYLLEQQVEKTEQVQMQIDIEILRSLTSTESLPNFCLHLLFEPSNLASQLDGASLLQLTASLTKLVQLLTTLEDYDKMTTILKTVSRLISSNATRLAIGRKQFQTKVIDRILCRMEKALRERPTRNPICTLTSGDALESEIPCLLTNSLNRVLRLWQSYVPEVPIDPLSVSTAEHTYLASLLSHAQGLRELLVEYESLQSGYRSNTRIIILDDDISTLQASFDSLPQPAVQRKPNAPTLIAIFSELKAFDIQFLADERIPNLIKEISSAVDQNDLRALQSRLKTFSVSAIGLLKRLTHRFPDFVDILRPIQTILDIVIISLTLKLRQATVSLFRASLDPLNDFMARFLPGSCTIAAAEMRSAVCDPKMDEIIRQETTSSRIPILRVAAISCEINGIYSSSELNLLVSEYDFIWKLWSMDRAKEEREAEERAQEFRFRRQDFNILSDEAIEAEELQTLFPTYDDEVSQPMERVPTSKSHAISSSQVDVLCHMHLAITLKDEVELEKPRWFEQLRKDLVIEIAEKHGHLLATCIDQKSLAFQVNHINQLQARIGKNPNSAPLQDFYKDSNVFEAMRILSPVRSLASKVKELLRQWPEMIALDEIGQRCQQIARLSCESPLAKIIPFVETLIGQIEEWEKYSCRENSLSSYQSIFADFVVGWRRLELTSWAGLIEREMRTFDSATNVWWFRLYELLFRGLLTQEAKDDADVDRYLADAATVLNEFMSECNLGQFRPRLTLLRSFSSLLRSYSEVQGGELWIRMYNLLEGIIFFSSHYATEISVLVDQAKTAARKEIENFIRLASWKDVNVFALRQSSHKSHRQLYKSVHRLRAALQRPVKDILQTWKLDKSSDLEFDLPPTVSRAIDIVHVDEASDTPLLPTHLKHPSQALERLQKFIERRLFSTMEVDVPAKEIKALAAHIRLVAKELSEETLPKGDAREKYARNLDLRKRKAFADLLKRLKTLGVGSSPTDRALERLKDPAVIFGQPLLASKSFSGMTKLCEAVDDGLYGLLSQMPKFRRCRNSHHSDISNSDMQRMIGSVESGLSLILSDRKILSSLLAAVDEIGRTCSRIADLLPSASDRLVAPTNSNGQPNIVMMYVKVINIFISALGEMSESVSILRSNQTVAEIPRTVSDLLNKLTASASSDITKLKTLMRIANETLRLFSPDEVELLASVPVRLRSIVEDIRSAAADVPTISFLLEPLAEDLSRQLSTLSSEFVDPVKESDLVRNTYRSFVDSVLLVAQQLMNRDSKIEDEALSTKVNVGEIRKGHRTLTSITLRCHVEDVLGKLRDFNRTISCTYPSTTGPQMLSNVARFAQQYLSLLAHHFKYCLLWHQAQLDLFHTVVSLGINIGENGFCKPDLREEEGETGGPDGPSVDGTGLGGGQGAKDVSDEIESDEQMEGLQNDTDEQEPKTEDGKEKEDRGVETKLEFDAPLEDVEEEDGSDSGNEGDEKDEEDGADEIEDGVGKVDPLDSGAVDEKFWEGEDEDEKEGEEQGEADMSAKQNQSAPKDSSLTAKENQKTGEQNAPDSKEGKDDAAENQEQVPEGDEGDDGLEEDEVDDGQDALDQSEVGEGEEGEDPAKNNPVPMMDHVDNTETLDLPDDLKLDDSKAEDEESTGGDDDADQGMELDEPDPTQGRSGTDEHDDQPDDIEDRQVLAPLDPVIPEAEPADGLDGGEESGAGTGGGGTSNAPPQSGFEPPDQASQEQSKPLSADQDEQPATEVVEDSEPHNKAAQGGEHSAAEDIGNGDCGTQPMPQTSEANPDELGLKDQQPDPNPLRNLADSMERWMRRLQHIQDGSSPQTDESKVEASNEAMELEYLQSDESDPTNQQAPGPATQDQAQEALKQLHIDEPVTESEIVRLEDERKLPPPVDFMQLPEINHLTEPVEPAITGPTGGAQNRTKDDRGLVNELGISDQPMELDEDCDEEVGTTSTLEPNVHQSLESDASAADIWRQYEHITRKPALQLTEQLRLILEPTTATRLEGDYRTGKRLNMRKLVPYLASDYTKDRIWLRRTKPAQRDYQILIAVDDSRSMADSRSAHLALQTVALVTSALSKLEVGEVAIARFGSSFNLIQPFGTEGGRQGGSNQGAKVVKGFTFSQQKTDVRLVVEEAMKMFETAHEQQSAKTVDEIWQLGIIVSDGICQDHEHVRALLRQATEKRIMFVFVILDSLHQHGEGDGDGDGDGHQTSAPETSSIVSMNTVSYALGSDGQMVLQMERYLDTFPFDYYIILRDVEALPHVLSGTLRQFFEKVCCFLISFYSFVSY
ncbi:hypothetical protein CROQUDRAFT_39244 [Cronartium quercuum f. sp. fusiforme G11]|uniref:Midasin n=1 Tax=Cronartium quercuum f. sp. fusiforme G11 TaxID=708437 RepID=A0A9P6TFE9_9BASI|nr:hypothetical protein CROQUDRAFT_39244 [Cronartium quercuum f. sp. fusiforme G11]